ncbi:Endoribonuclease L-PSP/chorismate mutase-like protein [Aspergillus novoparasiticus]|uniref:Endoribonuclease L-PSP/chorismate mutase-like protein n=1 Tax=Aspergillus novoparasiticus TaxID=986946 RepID=A0A5N6EMZ9_9EURO|nr:Endoribonuclease L-PSP/chorismate mutase-like protein [Aspergillus novoparasiticus]
MAIHCKYSSPSTVHPPRGYSHIVTVEGNYRTIEIAGQIGMTADGQLSDNYNEQVKQAFLNLKSCLEACASPSGLLPKITKLRYFIKDYVYPQRLDPVTEAKKILFGENDALPTSVLVSVPELGHPKMLFEVEATAVIESDAM